MENKNITSYNVENFGIKIKDATVTTVSVVERDPETKKQLTEQRCQVTGSKSRYLFTITKENGDTIQVKASVLKSVGLTSKEVDRLYSVGYYGNKPGVRKPVLSQEQQSEALDSFLNS